MGIYFNPSNASFRQARNSMVYVDKTNLLNFLNRRLFTDDKCIALSHARRFGKSHAAGMIDAYYSLGCDSTKLFEDTKLASNADYKKHMNKYNVIHLDISSFWDDFKDNIIKKIQEYILDEFKKEFKDKIDFTKKFNVVLMSIYDITNIPFVIIIDEWDCIIRNSHDENLIHKYLQFLHSLFKSEESKSFLALAYITGILPIKKIKDESALNNFREYTMLKSKPITEYYGFTEDEVKNLCKQYDMDFDSTKAWYNGYLIDGMHMYNPNSVSMAMDRQDFDSYWKNTSSFASINTFITMNYAGLKDYIMAMLAGGMVRVNTNTFKNDFSTIASKDDALTALIHLGYLGYEEQNKYVFIPNAEVQSEYASAVTVSQWGDISKALKNSADLLQAVWEKQETQVAEGIRLAHFETSQLQYNDENALSYTISLALYAARNFYTVYRELPGGKGFADLVFVPRKRYQDKPALVVELKWDKTAEGALAQIKDKEYCRSLEEYQGNLLLVGINYNKKTKEHVCRIEEYQK